MSNSEADHSNKLTEITEHNDVLLRQVHPTWIHEGRYGSQTFKPFPKDDGFLSLHEKGKIKPKPAFQIYTEIKKLQSVDVCALTVSEVQEEELKAFEDPSEDGPSPEADPLDEAHASIDFNGLSNGQTRKKAKTLARKANNRGSLL